MTAGLHLVARPAVSAQSTRTGRVTAPAQPAHVYCTTAPGTSWTETDPSRLDAAARALTEAAVWLRGEQAQHGPTLFDNPESDPKEGQCPRL